MFTHEGLKEFFHHLFNAYDHNNITYYIFNNDEGRKTGCLDLLYDSGYYVSDKMTGEKVLSPAQISGSFETWGQTFYDLEPLNYCANQFENNGLIIDKIF